MRMRQVLVMAAMAAGVLWPAENQASEAAIEQTALIHGQAGPFAVAGYRMGVLALQRLGLTRGSMDLEVTHYSPAKVQWSCVIDGLQAATGASLGKMNLHRVDSAQVYSLVKNKRTGETLRFELADTFLKANLDVPYPQLTAAGARAAKLEDRQLFRVR